MHVEEIQYQDFTEDRFGAIVSAVAGESGRPFNPSHFFRVWQAWMAAGIARAWAAEGCVLGAIVAPDTFSGLLRASVLFWFSLPEVRGTAVTGRVFKVFEDAVREAGCVDIQTAAHEALMPEHREAGYRKHGFRKSETIFVKELT